MTTHDRPPGVRPGKSRQPSLVAQVGLLVRREDLLSTRSAVLAMVSGGQDSVALLELLAGRLWGEARPGSLHVLHVNHHLRGQESDDDETLVREHCRRLQVGLTVAHLGIEKAGGNVQERAREARRAEALALAARTGCDRIALGHTADDQVENLLYRVGRYGGLAALRGMRCRDLPWIRPLLGVRREETAAFCRERSLPYAVDRGNAYPGYARTGIRERVLPAWEQELPGAVRGALRTSEVAGEIEEVLLQVMADTGVDLSSPVLDVPALLVLTPPLRRLVLHAWLDTNGGAVSSRAQVLAVEELLQAQGSAARDLEGGRRAYREYDRLWVGRAARGARAAASPPAPAFLSVPGEVSWGGVTLAAEPVGHFFAPDPAREAYVDARALMPPLQVRAPRLGDRVRPLGSPGTRKLQDLLVDLRVPAAVRPSVPLVVSGDDIVWVCGWAVAAHARIAPDTRAIVRLSLRVGASG